MNKQLNIINPKWRKAAELYLSERRNIHEVAEHLDITPSTATKYVAKGIRVMLRKHVHTIEAWDNPYIVTMIPIESLEGLRGYDIRPTNKAVGVPITWTTIQHNILLFSDFVDFFLANEAASDEIILDPDFEGEEDTVSQPHQPSLFDEVEEDNDTIPGDSFNSVNQLVTYILDTFGDEVTINLNINLHV